MIGCAGCKAKDQTINFLRETLEKTWELASKERSEYKRSIDYILANSNKGMVIGQGLSANEKTVEPMQENPTAEDPMKVFEDRGDPTQ